MPTVEKNSRVMLHFLKRAQVSEKSAKLNRLYGRIQTAWQNVFVFVLTSCKQATLLQKGGHSLALCSKGLAIIIIFQGYGLGNFFSEPDFITLSEMLMFKNILNYELLFIEYFR